MLPQTKTYTAVYRGQEDLPVALFREMRDADEWHQNPGVYSHCRRQIRFGASPMEVAGVASQMEARRLLDALVNGPDEPIPALVLEARKFLKSVNQQPTTKHED